MPRIRVLLLIGLGLVLTFIIIMQIADLPPAPEQQEPGPAAAAPLGPEFRTDAAGSAIRRQPRLCSTSFSARQFVAQVRAVASLTDPSGQRQVQGLPLFSADQARLVVDDSICAAVSRVLGGYINSGAFPRQHRLPPFPLTVVRARPKYFVRDIRSPGLLNHGESLVMVDTLQPPPKPGYVLPGPCWQWCCAPGRWTLLTPVTLRRDPSLTAPSIGQVSANAAVDADTGIAIVDTVGLVVVRAPVWSEYINDTLPPGDTLFTLHWTKVEDDDVPYYTAWWRGLVRYVDRFWDSAGGSGAQVMRAPHWNTWIRMATTNGGIRVRGWAMMTPDIQVGPSCLE